MGGHPALEGRQDSFDVISPRFHKTHMLSAKSLRTIAGNENDSLPIAHACE